MDELARLIFDESDEPSPCFRANDLKNYEHPPFLYEGQVVFAKVRIAGKLLELRFKVTCAAGDHGRLYNGKVGIEIWENRWNLLQRRTSNVPKHKRVK